MANGYPARRVDQVMKQRWKQHDEDSDVQENQVLLVLPYVQGLSEKIAKICSKFNIKTAFSI